MTIRILAPSRAHLATNRRMIIGRSLVSALAGAVPIPVLEDWLSSRVQRGTIARIADEHGVDMDDAAIQAVADGKTDPPNLGALAGGTLLYRTLGRRLRKTMLAYLALRRVRHAAKVFEVATLFDHYCARLHVGLGLDGESGAAVRAAIDDSIAATPGRLSGKAFRRGMRSAAIATVRAPMELLDIASGGALRRLLRGRDEEVEAIAEMDDAIERSLAAERGFLRRATIAVERQLSASANPYVDRLLSTFEDLWRARNPTRGDAEPT